MAGRYNFNIPGRLDASIVNKGTITASSGGFAALVAPGVRNSGPSLPRSAPWRWRPATVFTLALYGDKLITLAVGEVSSHQLLITLVPPILEHPEARPVRCCWIRTTCSSATKERHRMAA